MKEIVEFRLESELVAKHLPLLRTKPVSSNPLFATVSVAYIDIHDPVIEELRKLALYYRSQRTHFSTSYITRTYDPDEIETAEYFVVKYRRARGQCLEQHGIEFIGGCQICGGNQIPVGKLKKDIIRGATQIGTHAFEFLAEPEALDIWNDSGGNPEDWHDLEAKNPCYLWLPKNRCNISNQTQYGECILILKNPEPHYSCGHVIGFNRLSQLFIERDSLDPNIPCYRTRQLAGHTSGYHYPTFEIIVRGDVFRKILSTKLKRSLYFEIARLV